MSDILKVISLTKKYGKDGGVVALDDVDLTISEGDFVSIQGPSGSGKSTLLNCIGALDKPTEGEVMIDSKNISKMSQNELAKLRREKIGFIFQSFNLLPILNAAENVELAMENTGLGRKEMRERSLKLLKTVGLQDRLYLLAVAHCRFPAADQDYGKGSRRRESYQALSCSHV